MKSSKLEIALVQTSLVWENPKENRQIIAEKIKEIKPSTDIIILPEMFTTGFTMSPKKIDFNAALETLKWMKTISKEKNAALVGSIVYKEETKNYNRLYFVEPSGKVSFYNKRHTFTLAGEDKVYTAGKEKLIVEYKGFKICPLICYDLRFPVWSRNTTNYDVLIYVANWPKKRILAWDSLLRARAIENMAYCIGVNRVGIDALAYEYPGHSSAYDSLGTLLSFSDKEEVIYATITKEHINTTRNKLKFLEDKDLFNLL
ncbi:putative amidohydrolase [Maribacter vaceletii]|uniref:Omega-amidase YafV n=1 Tax=Maribacter vaceletii TaxID=1206816 RepID=A0A495EDS4_9FLAO|nr:nitrilase family protein [Maribacter vaceletii]RKR15022.1 putative amidohydrolase [Maribacter vaceletii]